MKTNGIKQRAHDSKKEKYLKILAVLVMFGAVGFGYILGTTPSVRQAIFGKTVQERQVDELKAHEQEIISFVKAQNPKVTSVQIDWKRTDWGQRGPLVTEEVVTVHGHFNHLKNSGWSVNFVIKNKEVDFDTMEMGNPLRVGGLLYE